MSKFVLLTSITTTMLHFCHKNIEKFASFCKNDYICGDKRISSNHHL